MKIFIDSSILIEYIKANQVELLEQLISSDNELYTNAIVYSEFMFYYLAIIGGKSPLTIKESKQIKAILEKHNPFEIFQNFQILSIDNDTVTLSYDYMRKYNFLPNDALILATVKLNELTYIASFDEKDFTVPCKKEKIKLIKSIFELL